ncbi:MAG: acylneuraminate cytidylyltransferase family protein [Brevinemataceae bacterium]
MKNIVFIPLRGGSTSIPLKNIKLLNGKPLAYYVIDAAVQSKYIDTVVISTDSEQIKQTISQYPSEKIQFVNRSSAVSTNEASTMSVVSEFSKQYDYDTMVLVQATSPLLRARDIDGGFELLKSGYDSVLSVVRQHRFIWDEKTNLPLNFTLGNKPRRQDWDGILIENGAFYINSRKNILADSFYLSGKIGLYEMDPRTYIELDDPLDWFLMERLMEFEVANN